MVASNHSADLESTYWVFCHVTSEAHSAKTTQLPPVSQRASTLGVLSVSGSSTALRPSRCEETMRKGLAEQGSCHQHPQLLPGVDQCQPPSLPASGCFQSQLPSYPPTLNLPSSDSMREAGVPTASTSVMHRVQSIAKQ